MNFLKEINLFTWALSETYTFKVVFFALSQVISVCVKFSAACTLYSGAYKFPIAQKHKAALAVFHYG